MNTTIITGREPRLSMQVGGKQRLSLKKLGNLLSALSPDSITSEAALAMLHSEDFAVRYNAARILSERGNRESKLVMQQALKTGNAPTRASVTRHLHRFSWYAAKPLLNQAIKDTDVRVREGAVYALCDMRHPEAYTRLMTVLDVETDNTVLEATAVGLRDNQDEGVAPVLALALRADDPSIRIKVMEALSVNDTSAAADIVRQTLDTEQDQDVLYNAALSLIEIEEEKCLPEMLERILVTSDEDRVPLLRGFYHATNYLFLDMDSIKTALLATIKTILATDHLPARLATIWILTWLRDDEANEILLQAYADNPALRLDMLHIVVNLMSPVSDQLIENALHDADESLREKADYLRQLKAAGIMAQYDEHSTGMGFSKPSLGM